LLGTESLANVLLAVATGFPDRALNVVAMSDELDDADRSALYRVLSDGGDATTVARRLGDVLRSLGADRRLINECYRVAFYTGDAWKDLSGTAMFGYFSANRAGRTLDKWIHYFPIYERHLARYRGRAVRLLEIGVYGGGGLDLFQAYLGPDATLVGIDIDESTRIATAGGHPVEIGDQADPDFLERVVSEHGPFDIVVDDGGHTMVQQVTSVETLFPLLTDGGTYIVEDSHTSYWPDYADQGPDRPTFVEWAKRRIDDLHAYHHSSAEELEAPWQTHLGAIHAYDSVVVLDRARHDPPFSELAGTKEFISFSRGMAASQVELVATRAAAIAQAAEAEQRAAKLIAEADDRVARAAAAGEESIEEVRLLRGELVEAQRGNAQLRAEMEEVQGSLRSIDEELARTRGDLLGAWGIIQDMRRSASWRVTGPLRRVKSIVRRE
jgi:cephalosporin hydroxylase